MTSPDQAARITDEPQGGADPYDQILQIYLVEPGAVPRAEASFAVSPAPIQGVILELLPDRSAGSVDPELDESIISRISELPLPKSKDGPKINPREVRRVERARDDPNVFEALLTDYQGLIRIKAATFFLIGGDHKDLLQEGNIGFWQAVSGYDGTSGSFRNFAELCITRKMISAVKAGTRRKHSPLHNYVSLWFELEDRSGTDNISTGNTKLETLGDPSEDPVEKLIASEGLRALVDTLSTRLSELESSALSLFLDGKTYNEIGQELGVSARTIDNALQRMRKKVKRHHEITGLSTPD